jgi:hypothetical protein
MVSSFVIEAQKEDKTLLLLSPKAKRVAAVTD